MGLLSFVRGLLSRSIENPAYHVSDADQWLANTGIGGIEGGLMSDADVRVSHTRALMHSPVWRGIALLSGDVARLPLYIYRRTGPDGESKEAATQHPAYRLLRWQANEEMSAFAFWQQLIKNAILDGNGLAYIAHRGDGTPAELLPLPPGNAASPVRVNGQLQYYVQFGDTFRWLRPDEVLHVHGIGWDGLSGYPLYAVGKNGIGLGIAAEKFANRYFANSAEPGVVITHPKSLSDKARANLIASWKAMHQGLDASHRTALLEEGSDVKAIGNSARDAQLLELRQFQIRDVANWLGVPPHKLGDTTRTAYASIEAENADYLNTALEPWLVNIEQECRRKLLSQAEQERDTHVVEFLRLALLKADATARSTLYHSALQDGWMSPDEVRARENLGPLPDGQGAIFYRPLNMSIAGREDDAAGVAFQREVVAAFIADGTVSDVIANSVDIAELVKAAGLPANADYSEPYLPVIADNGQPVTGEVVTDSEGDIVGGATEETDDAEQDEPAEDDVASAAGDVLTDAIDRMAQRMVRHYCRNRDHGIDKHRGIVRDALRPATRAYRTATGAMVSASWLTDELLEGLTRLAARCKNQRSLAVAMGWAQRNLPRLIMRQLNGAVASCRRNAGTPTAATRGPGTPQTPRAQR